MSSTSALSATFNDFLFATVCEERNEMQLSVISALARQDLDPWTEAAELARMPADGAARRLSSLLAGVVNDPPTWPDHATIAVRLVALLPTSAETDVPPRARVAGVMTAGPFRAVRMMCLFLLASMAVSVLLANLGPRAGASAPASGPIPSTAAHR
jgi:hypothetical protein